MIDPEAYSILIQNTDADEGILWSGRPKLGLIIQKKDKIAFVTYALFMAMVTVILFVNSNNDYGFLIFAATIGLIPLIRSLVIETIIRANTFYGITTDKIIIIKLFPFRKVKTYNLKDISDIRLFQRNDGFGTITLKKLESIHPFLPDRMEFGELSIRYSTPKFELIPESRKVHELVLETKRTLQ